MGWRLHAFHATKRAGCWRGNHEIAKTNANQNMFIYILVGDINAELPKMKEIGWEIVEGRMPITGVGFFAVLKDFDGNTINLFESLPRQP